MDKVKKVAEEIFSEDFFKKKALPILALYIVACFMLFAQGLLSQYQLIPTEGTITTIGVSTDRSFIDWGLLYRGQNATTAVIVTNDGNIPIELTLSTSDKPSFIETGWNLQNELLEPHASAVGTIWLKISETTTATSFAFNYTIVGTQT
jgi:hypothetical protein